jgi:hypothetical protein
MNCEGYRDKLIDALASGESVSGGEVVAHLRVCAECKKFYETQVRLFGAIDSGVRAVVNESVPASLLPRVRARMKEVQMAGTNWKLSWNVVAVAGVVVLAALGFVARREPRPTAVLVETAAGARIVPGKITRVLAPEKAEHPIIRRRHRESEEPYSNTESPNCSSEVLVPGEERVGYEQYIRTVRAGSRSPAKETKFVDPIEIATQEIAQLQIQKLEMNSLAEEARE